MSKELDWIRSKAKMTMEETLSISPEKMEELEGTTPAGTYRVKYYRFVGYVPKGMMVKLRKGPNPLIKEELDMETLYLGTGYQSGWNKVEYLRVTYTHETPWEG